VGVVAGSAKIAALHAQYFTIRPTDQQRHEGTIQVMTERVVLQLFILLLKYQTIFRKQESIVKS
jgi:hypothetical protein